MKPQQANAIVYAVQTALKAHEILELEKKIKQLEELLDGLKEKN
jgi:glycogen debranching enzyme